MLTAEDEVWLNHLSDTNQVKIVPFDPQVKHIFSQIKQEIQSALGENISVLHMGATSLGISGKGDIDVYIPTSPEQFSLKIKKLEQIYGKPGSLYPLKRVRWNKLVKGIDVEIFLVNQDHLSWKRSLAFENYLKQHPEALDEYEKLKEDLAGVSTREYYRRKIEFMNKILGIR